MVRVTEINGITGEPTRPPSVLPTEDDGEELALDLLSLHLIEFDTIAHIKKAGEKIYSIRHFDGSYAPFEVRIDVLMEK